MSLLAAAKDDVATFMLQDEEIQQHRSFNLISRGKGPTDVELAANERHKQELEAKGLAQIITDREALKKQRTTLITSFLERSLNTSLQVRRALQLKVYLSEEKVEEGAGEEE